MKAIIVIVLCIGSSVLVNQPVCAQINPLKKLKNKTNEKINKGIDKSFDKVFDKKEKNKKVKKGEEVAKPASTQVQPSDQAGAKPGTSTSENKTIEHKTPQLQWSKYDFVPGDKIIFEDNLIGEENGEFPSRWDLKQGNVENAVFGGKNVIMFRGGRPIIVPYLKNPNIDYLPEIFTIEFDLFLPYNSFTVYFYDRKNQNSPSGHSYLNVWSTSMDLNPAKSSIPDGKSINKKWAHIAVAYTNGKLKAYINETRLINIPHLTFNPAGVSLSAYHANDNNAYYIKNIRMKT